MARNGTPDEPRLSAVQEKVVSLMAAGVTTTEAAEQAGIGRRTVYNWLSSDAAFVARLNSERRAVAERMAADRDALVSEAFAAMRGLLGPDTPPAIRLKAAESVLSTFGKPAPPDHGPDTPKGVTAAWQAEQAHRERERRKAERWSLLDDFGPPSPIG